MFGPQSPFRHSFGKILRAYHTCVRPYSIFNSRYGSYGGLTLEYDSSNLRTLKLACTLGFSGRLLDCLPFELLVPDPIQLLDIRSLARLPASISGYSSIPHSVCIAMLRICPNLKALVFNDCAMLSIQAYLPDDSSREVLTNLYPYIKLVQVPDTTSSCSFRGMLAISRSTLENIDVPMQLIKPFEQAGICNAIRAHCLNLKEVYLPRCDKEKYSLLLQSYGAQITGACLHDFIEDSRKDLHYLKLYSLARG